MEAREILKLVEAGFSKEEIMVLAKADRQPEAAPAEPEKTEVTEPAAEPAAEPAKEPEAAPEASPQEAVNAAVKEALKPFEDLYDHMAKLAGMPSIDNIQPKSIDDIVDNFFKGE